MRKMIWLTTIFVLFIVFVIPGFLAASLKIIPANNQPGYNSNVRLSIYEEREITQRFISKVNNLTAIGTSIRNPNLKNKTDVNFILYDDTGNQVRSVVLNGQNLEDGSFVKFVFPEVPNSEGKNYSFRVSSPGAGPGETIEVFILDKPDTSSGMVDYSYLGKAYPGGVPFVVYDKPISRLNTVKRVYTNWLSRLLLTR